MLAVTVGLAVALVAVAVAAAGAGAVAVAVTVAGAVGVAASMAVAVAVATVKKSLDVMMVPIAKSNEQPQRLKEHHMPSSHHGQPAIRQLGVELAISAFQRLRQSKEGQDAKAFCFVDSR